MEVKSTVKERRRTDILRQHKALVDLIEKKKGTAVKDDGKETTLIPGTYPEERRIPDLEGGGDIGRIVGGGCFLEEVRLKNAKGNELPEGAIEIINNPFGPMQESQNYIERFEVETVKENMKTVKKIWFSPSKGFHKIKVDAQTGKVLYESYSPLDKEDEKLIKKAVFDV